jgi:ketosteroid isomerase-like protein
MSDKLREIAKKWNDAWNGGDAGALVAFFADGGTYYEPSMAGPVAAAEGIKSSAETTWRDWPGATFEAVTVIVGGDKVAVEWRSSATHRIGTDVNLEGVDILEFDGDKIKSCRVYYDIHTRRQALEK